MFRIIDPEDTFLFLFFSYFWFFIFLFYFLFLFLCFFLLVFSCRIIDHYCVCPFFCDRASERRIRGLIRFTSVSVVRRFERVLGTVESSIRAQKN